MTRIYVSSPVACYQRKGYAVKIDHIKRLAGVVYDDVEMVPAKGRYGSFQAWKQRWPSDLESMDAVVFFTDGGTIGRAGYWEIEDAQKAGLPVYWYVGHELRSGFDIAIIDHGASYTRYARVTKATIADGLPQITIAPGPYQEAGQSQATK